MGDWTRSVSVSYGASEGADLSRLRLLIGCVRDCSGGWDRRPVRTGLLPRRRLSCCNPSTERHEAAWERLLQGEPDDFSSRLEDWENEAKERIEMPRTCTIRTLEGAVRTVAGACCYNGHFSSFTRPCGGEFHAPDIRIIVRNATGAAS